VSDREICETWKRCHDENDYNEFISKFVPACHYACLKEAILKSLYYYCIWDPCPKQHELEEIECYDLETLPGQSGKLTLLYPSKTRECSSFYKRKISNMYLSALRRYCCETCSTTRDMIIDSLVNSIEFVLGLGGCCTIRSA
jgi:hypothetical protein